MLVFDSSYQCNMSEFTLDSACKLWLVSLHEPWTSQHARTSYDICLRRTTTTGWDVTDYMGASLSVGCRHTVHVWGKALRIHKRPTPYWCSGFDLLLLTLDQYSITW